MSLLRLSTWIGDSLFPCFSLPDVLWDPTDLIWRKETPFEAMNGRTAPSSDGLLAEVSRGFPQPGDLCTALRIISLSLLSIEIDVTDATLGASDLWLGTRIGAGGAAILTKSFFGRSPWLHGVYLRMQLTNCLLQRLCISILDVYQKKSYEML